MDPRLSECWEELSDFILFRNSLDLGALAQLMEIFVLDADLHPSAFADQITTFLTAVSSQAKMRPQGEADVLALLAVDSLINNLYLYGRNGQAFQPNSSSFYGWMSSSQMSIDHSNVSDREGQVLIVPELMAALANSQPFFKRLNNSMEKGSNQQRLKRYAQSLLETIDSILTKQKISKETFLKLRGKYVGLQSRRRWEVNYARVNSVIFSSQLNKVVVVLAEGGDDVHLALLRIYLSCQQEVKMFQGVSFNGEEMLVNLYRYYVSSFKDQEELFEQGKHPLFRFLRNHLALLFTPILRRFHQIVVKIAPRCGIEPGLAFYKSGASILESELGEFLSELPTQLLRLLLQLKELVQEQHPGQSEFALSAVKKLLFYSFLLNQSLIEELYPRYDPTKLSLAYNHVLNLFFQGSLKKYSNLPQSQQAVVSQLIDKLAGNLDSRILNQFVKVQQDESSIFKMRQSVLNHDYEIILGVLSSLEFTPKDSKQFEMKKTRVVAPESPVYKHFKGQVFKTEERQEQVELATWMSVGGSRQWGTRPSKQHRGGVAERLKGFKTISLRMRSELSGQSEQLRGYFV